MRGFFGCARDIGHTGQWKRWTPKKHKSARTCVRPGCKTDRVYLGPQEEKLTQENWGFFFVLPYNDTFLNASLLACAVVLGTRHFDFNCAKPETHTLRRMTMSWCVCLPNAGKVFRGEGGDDENKKKKKKDKDMWRQLDANHHVFV